MIMRVSTRVNFVPTQDTKVQHLNHPQTSPTSEPRIEEHLVQPRTRERPGETRPKKRPVESQTEERTEGTQPITLRCTRRLSTCDLLNNSAVAE